MNPILDRFPSLRIAVMGDPIEDLYHFGRVDRMCPEAPVPVFIEEKLEGRPGGANNVAANLEALGVKVDRFFPSLPWTVKHRYIAGHHQIMRVDRDANHRRVHSDFGRFPIWAHSHKPDAAIISDYGKGWCTRQRCKGFMSQLVDTLVVVDPKGIDWDRYDGCDWVCPNESEWYANMDAYDLGRASWQYLLKRGAKGLQLRFKDGHEFNMASRSRAVYDVTGAGDTVTAMFTASLAAGATPVQAANLANLAASIVVGKVGTSTVTIQELERELKA